MLITRYDTAVIDACTNQIFGENRDFIAFDAAVNVNSFEYRSHPQ